MSPKNKMKSHIQVMSKGLKLKDMQLTSIEKVFIPARLKPVISFAIFALKLFKSFIHYLNIGN